MHQEFFGSTQFDPFLAERKRRKSFKLQGSHLATCIAPKDLACPWQPHVRPRDWKGKWMGWGVPSNKRDLGEACGFSKWCAAIMLVLLKLLDFYM